MIVLTPDAVATEPAPAAGAVAHRGWRAFFGHRAAAVSLVFLVALGVLAVAAPLLVRLHLLADPYRLGPAPPHRGPSAGHLLGTDYLGRDLLARTLFAARVSLSIAVLVQVVTLFVGGAIGTVAGYGGGTVDAVLMRVTDVAYAFPSLLFVLFIAAVRGPGYWNILLAVAAVRWPFLARLVRAEVRSVKTREYVEAARAVGTGPGRLLGRHIAPNCLGPVVVTLAFGVPSAIYFETFLSFLGVGIRPPAPSWGAMINTGYQAIFAYPHEILAPTVAISLVTLAFNLLGDGLRDAFDPRAATRAVTRRRGRAS